MHSAESTVRQRRIFFMILQQLSWFYLSHRYTGIVVYRLWHTTLSSFFPFGCRTVTEHFMPSSLAWLSVNAFTAFAEYSPQTLLCWPILLIIFNSETEFKAWRITDSLRAIKLQLDSQYSLLSCRLTPFTRLMSHVSRQNHASHWPIAWGKAIRIAFRWWRETRDERRAGQQETIRH